MYEIIFQKQALKDLELLKKYGLSTKAKALVDHVRGDPFYKASNFEKLKGKLQNYYSRRINIQHRLVYQIYECPHINNGVDYQGYIKIIRMWTHYQ